MMDERESGMRAERMFVVSDLNVQFKRRAVLVDRLIDAVAEGGGDRHEALRQKGISLMRDALVRLKAENDALQAELTALLEGK